MGKWNVLVKKKHSHSCSVHPKRSWVPASVTIAGAILRCLLLREQLWRIGVRRAVCRRAAEKSLDERDVHGSQAPSRQCFLPLDLCRVETACSVGHNSSAVQCWCLFPAVWGQWFFRNSTFSWLFSEDGKDDSLLLQEEVISGFCYFWKTCWYASLLAK